MSTIVTYNRGAQGLPVAEASTDARLRFWEDFDGTTSKFSYANGFASVQGGGGAITNGTIASVTKAVTPKFVGDLRTKGDSISFLARTKFAGRAGSGVINEVGFGFSNAAQAVGTNAPLFGMEVHSHALGADDAFACRVDTNNPAGDSGTQSGKIQLVKGLEDFDSTEYFTVGGVMINEGDHYKAQFFVNGVQVKELRVVTSSSGFVDGICLLYAHQPIVSTPGAVTIDYIAADCPR